MINGDYVVNMLSEDMGDRNLVSGIYMIRGRICLFERGYFGEKTRELK